MIISSMILFVTALIILGMLPVNHSLKERIKVIDAICELDDAETFGRSYGMYMDVSLRDHVIAYVRGKYDRKTFYGVE